MKRILSFFLIIALFAGHSNLTYARHFCSGIVVQETISVGETDMACGMSALSQLAHDDCEAGQAIAMPSCCNSDYLPIGIDNPEAQRNAEQLSLAQLEIGILASLYATPPLAKTSEIADYSDSSPPLVRKQARHILYCSLTLYA